jgi:hypothetical protein
MQRTLQEISTRGHSERIESSMVTFQQREEILGTETYRRLDDEYSH